MGQGRTRHCLVSPMPCAPTINARSTAPNATPTYHCELRDVVAEDVDGSRGLGEPDGTLKQGA